jgi:hypothetical protein
VKRVGGRKKEGRKEEGKGCGTVDATVTLKELCVTGVTPCQMARLTQCTRARPVGTIDSA